MLKCLVVRAAVLEGNLLPALVVKCLLVGWEHKSIVLLVRFRFVLRGKPESKISIRIRQLRGSSSGTARAR